MVVTIIVLLILAAIALNLTIGQNGIIARAMDAKEKSEIADEKEAISLAYQSCIIDTLGENVKANELENELKSQGRDVSVTQSGENLIVTYNQTSRVYQVNQNGDVSQEENANISISMKVIYNNLKLNADDLPNVKEVTNENVPIPEGFYYVGGTKDTGLVISDVEGDDLENTLQGNQFVWVPVNQNQVLKIEVSSKENISQITLYNPDDTYQTLNANGKTFSQEIAINQNGTYVLEVKTASEKKVKELKVTSLYAQDKESWVNALFDYIKDNVGDGIDFDGTEATEKYETTADFLKAKGYESENEFLKNEEDSILETWNKQIPYPGIIKKLYAKYGISMYLYANSTLIRDRMKEFTNLYFDLESENYKYNFKYIMDNNQNTDSVNKYGGFYIGRYESGVIGQNSDSESTSSQEGVVVKKGWKKIIGDDFNSCEQQTSNMYKDDQSVKTQIISGSGWDRTMNWLIETGDKTSYEVYYDSNTWGNYADAVGNAAIGAGENTSTGASEYWKANNIYDLAGNYYEMTQEKYEDIIIFRGGDTLSPNCDNGPAGRRQSFSDYDNKAFRVQLFINI